MRFSFFLFVRAGRLDLMADLGVYVRYTETFRLRKHWVWLITQRTTGKSGELEESTELTTRGS